MKKLDEFTIVERVVAPKPKFFNFYNYSSALIEPGDHLRLQDITLNYTIGKEDLQAIPFDKIHLYIFMQNPGMLWKASDQVQDPDYQYGKRLKTVAFGLKIDF